jgi:hypothetical protein
MAALAKASSLTAALIAGLAAGFFGYVSGSLSRPAFRGDAVVSAAVLVSALALVAAALYLEHGCRARPSGDVPGTPSGPG